MRTVPFLTVLIVVALLAQPRWTGAQSSDARSENGDGSYTIGPTTRSIPISPIVATRAGCSSSSRCRWRKAGSSAETTPRSNPTASRCGRCGGSSSTSRRRISRTSRKTVCQDDPEQTHHNWVMAGRRTTAALDAAGYEHRFVFSLATGHCDRRVYATTLADTLVWLWRGYEAP